MIKQLRYFCTILLIAVASVAWGDTYTQLTSISDIDETAEYVLGIEGTGFHYEGISSWGKTALPIAHAPIYYTLTKAADGSSFTAKADISEKTYYLQVPTTNTFSMAESTDTNTDLIIGTTKVEETNYAVANKTTPDRHLRINGTSGLRSYAGETGSMAFFYKVVRTATPELSFEVSSKTIAIGERFIQTPTKLNAEGLDVTYSSSDESVASVDASTGSVFAVSKGDATITAMVTLNGNDYKATYEIKVIEVVDGLFDFTSGYGYGSGLFMNADGSYITEDHTWKAGDVTIITSGKYRWWSDGTIRLFSVDGGNTSLTLSVPEGNVITQVEITGGNDYKTLVTNVGTYAEGTWTGTAQTVVFSRGTANAQIKTITVTYGDGVAKADAELSFTELSFTAELGGQNEFPTLTNPHNLSVSYSSSNEAVAKIDAIGTVTLVAAGTTTITASSEESVEYNADEVSYILTVVDPNIPGTTAGNPYTVEQARDALDAETGVTGVYVKGVVSEIVTAYNDQYGNISYNISDDGTTTANQLLAYRGKSYNGENFTSADDIRVGDKVVVFGNLTIHNNTIYEFTANNQLVSLEREVEKKSADLSFSEVELNAMLGQDNEFPTLDNPNSLDVTYSSSNEGVATVNSEGVVTLVAAGTTTIKAISEETEDYYAGMASYTLIVVDPSLISNVIDLRGKTEPLIFAAPLNGFIHGSGYNSYESVSLMADDNVEYTGWSATDVMTGNTNCLQLKASTGCLVSPIVLSDKGVKIEVVASTNTGAVVVGEDTEDESLSTALTETNFKIIASGSKYAVISSLIITPLTEAPKVKPELSVEDLVLNIGDEEPLTVNTNSSGSMTFTSSDEEVAVVVEGVTGFIVKALSLGTTTINVNLEETDVHLAAETSFTVTVKDPNALNAMFNFDEDYATLFPTLEGVSSGSGDNYVGSGDILEDVTAVVDGIRLTVSAADEEAMTPNRIWTASPRLRMYSGTLTVEAPSGYVIAALEFNDNAKWNANNTADSGTLSDKGWIGEAQSVVITIAGNTQLKYLNVIYKKVAVLPGDVNKDGQVTVDDLEALVKILLGTNTAEDDYNMEAADVNGDEEITVADVSALVDILVGGE